MKHINRWLFSFFILSSSINLFSSFSEADQPKIDTYTPVIEIHIGSHHNENFNNEPIDVYKENSETVTGASSPNLGATSSKTIRETGIPSDHVMSRISTHIVLGGFFSSMILISCYVAGNKYKKTTL